jgi:ribosomal protein S18 acetylase RimI-like enzyme
LRPVTPEDYDFLYALHKATIGDYVAATWGRWDEAFQQEHFHRHFNPAIRQMIVVAGQPAGVLALEERPDELYLALIELAPAFQNQGLGGEIISTVMRSAAAQGRPVALQVLKVNPARALYERLGFRLREETPTHYSLIWQP